MKENMRRERIASTIIASVLSICVCASAEAQIKIHSHNDYRRDVPFYEAYSADVWSIEVETWLAEDGKLMVAHDEAEIPTAQTFDKSYLAHSVESWRRDGRGYTLMFDVKTDASKTLDALVATLNKYGDVFKADGVRVVISGNRPSPDTFEKYPLFISFDGSVGDDYTPAQLARVAFVSDDFTNYSRWNGKGVPVKEDTKRLNDVIERVHAMGKPIRFWAAPDNLTAWNTLYNMGVDIIGTDRPQACAEFFHDFGNKTFSRGVRTTDSIVVNAKILDKTTSGFEGFDNKDLSLAKPQQTYTPTFTGDGANRKAMNVILLIGDGMGLSQIRAAETVNGALTMTALRKVGLQRTSSADAYTTDSAGAGSSIATGRKNANRHISADGNGEPYVSITETLAPHGVACGVVTLGNIADATPAAFYGHSAERDDSDRLTGWLTEGHLSLLAGSGRLTLFDREDGRDIGTELRHAGYEIIGTADSLSRVRSSKVVCLDERMDAATTPASLSLLAEAAAGAIEKLSASDKGFFLVVEGAKIDYAGHANTLPASVMETLGFDKAVETALWWADNNGDTLVIVTGDHETGGLTLIDGSNERGSITGIYVTDDHTPVYIPVFAYGPGSDSFTGVYENTELFHRILNNINY